MGYVLYGSRRSGSLAVELALAEIGVGYETRNVDLHTHAQRDEKYAAVNPQRKLPTLMTASGETLTESLAILLTLEERHPDAQLLPPQGSSERAQGIRMLAFIATEIYPIVEINDYPQRFSPTPNDASETQEIARRIWRERWLLVEQSIQGNPFFLSNGFCLTDIYIAVVSRWAQQDEWRPEHLPKVERLTRAVATRPACKSVWAHHAPQMSPPRFK